MDRPLLQVLGADCSDNTMWTTALQDGAEALGDIPRISVYGEEDGVFSVSSCQEAAEVLGIEEEKRYPLPGVGHLCMLEGHEAVTRICQDFITKL